MRYWILPLALAMFYAGVSEAEAQRQHEGAGEYSIEADLVDLDAGWVTLRTSDGRLIDLPATQLSRADQRWVQAHAPAHQKPAYRTRQVWDRCGLTRRGDRRAVLDYPLRWMSLRCPMQWTTISLSSRRIS